MIVRPGRSLILASALLLAGSLLVFVWAGVILVEVLTLLLLTGLAVLDYLDLKKRLADVRVARRLPNLVGRGRPFDVTWVLERNQPGPLRGAWRDGLPSDCDPPLLCRSVSLSDREFVVEQTSSLRIPVRGEHAFGPMWVRLVGRFGILEAQRTFELPAIVRVVPETYHSPEELQKEMGVNLLFDKKSHARQHGTGTEFESLTEFREGDDPRRIDWRATARMNRPIIRRFQIERHRDVLVLIDCGRMMGADVGRGSKLDCAIDAALMLARVALQGADRCGMALFDDQVLGYLAPVSGLPSLGAMADCVYAASTRWRETDFARMFSTLQQRHSKRSLIVVLSDMTDLETTERFRLSLARLAKHHVVLFAALQTPALEQQVCEPLTDGLDAARHVVALQLQREREQALHGIRRSGVQVLDVAPSQLIAPLINRFLELRHQSEL
jgi:uncharacterized protein (DUF58 family)